MNLITCCSPCNRLKNDRTPEQRNMKMNILPYEPNLFSEIINSSVGDIWEDFKSHSIRKHKGRFHVLLVDLDTSLSLDEFIPCKSYLAGFFRLIQLL